MTQAAYDTAVLALSGLQYYWPLSEASGTTYVDLKAANNASAAAVPARVTGPDGKGKAVDFAKTANSVGIPGSEFILPSRHAFFYWIKLDAQTAEDAFALEWSSPTQVDQHNIGWRGTFEGGGAETRILFTVFYGGPVEGAFVTELRTILPTGTWKFVVVNVDPTEGSGNRFYLDHVETGHKFGAHQTGVPVAGVLGIGGHGLGGRSNALNGALQGVGLVDRPLTLEEMKTLFRAMTKAETEIVEEKGEGSARAQGTGEGAALELEPVEGAGAARAAGEAELQDAKIAAEGEGSAEGQGVGFFPHVEPPIPPELEELWKRGHRAEDKIPQYIGSAIPTQVVKIRLGRFSHYWQDNETPGETSGEERTPMGCGHQPWDNANFPCLARVGLHGGARANPHYDDPWQAKFLGLTDWVEIPNVLEVRLDKKLEGLVAAVGQATVTIENILYPARSGPPGPLGEADYHARERGAMAPLRGVLEAGNEFAPDVATMVGIAEWLAELSEITEGFAANEWEGRFSYAAQVQVYQGYGAATMKTFTGLIESSDATSKPDRIVVTARDFGQVFTDTHFFGWGTDPIIRGPVVFSDRIGARDRAEVPSPAEVKKGQHAKASSSGAKHQPDQVLDYKYSSWWESTPDESAEADEFIEIAIPEGVYTFADIRVHYAHMALYLSLKPSRLEGGAKPPTRRVRGHLAEDMEPGGLIDVHGWVDPTRKEEQIVPGAGYSYMTHFADYPTGDQRTPFDHSGASPAEYRVGDNSILRITLRHLHKVKAGDYRAAVSEFHALREVTKEDAVGRREWVLTDDVADVIRILCQWAGFKEWDIPDTGAALPKRIEGWPNESYMDLIKKIAEGFNLIFFMADPIQDGPHGEGAESLGVPTMRRSRVVSLDSERERELRSEGIEAERGGTSAEFQFPNRGSMRTGLPRPVVSDRILLEAIDLQQKNEVLSSLIRIYGLTKSQPGDMAEAIDTGHFVTYTFRPPWAGVPADRYAHSQLAGVQKAVVIKDPLFATVGLCRNAALWVALRQAIESAEATIQIPALPILEIDDHLTLMDAGTGVATRLGVFERSSVFKDGEQRSYTMSITGALVDVPNVRDMVNIVNEITKPNGAGEELSSPKEGTPSSLGYG